LCEGIAASIGLVSGEKGTHLWGLPEEEGEACVAVGPLWSTPSQRKHTPSCGRNCGETNPRLCVSARLSHSLILVHLLVLLFVLLVVLHCIILGPPLLSSYHLYFRLSKNRKELKTM
jgi:hypothetical protein